MVIFLLAPTLLMLAGRAHAVTENLKAMMASPVELTIYSSDGKLVIGHSRYTIQQTGKNAVLSGNTNYLNGERDDERVELELVADNPLPIVTSFNADYFAADGSPELIEKADFRTGLASCHWGSQLHPTPYDASLDFPPDTYAGAASVVPLQYALQKGEQVIHFHVFECAPKPNIYAMDAKLESADSHWGFYPREVAKVGLSPDLGFLNILVRPFIPTISVYFDPDGGWQYVGAFKDRFYEGRTQILARKPPAQVQTVPIADQSSAAGSTVDPTR